MRKLSVILEVIAIIVLAIAAFTPVPDASAEAAIVVKTGPGSCSLLSGDGQVVSGDGAQVVVNDNLTHFRCFAESTNNSTRTAVHFDSDNNPFGAGLQVNCNGVLTTNWFEQVSASGNATLHCKAPR